MVVLAVGAEEQSKNSGKPWDLLPPRLESHLIAQLEGSLMLTTFEQHGLYLVKHLISLPAEGYPLKSAATFAADLRRNIQPQIDCN